MQNNIYLAKLWVSLWGWQKTLVHCWVDYADVLFKFNLHTLLDPGKLPQISSRYMLKQTSAPMSKTQRISEMACTKISGSVQPLSTWKLTPMTSIFSSFSCSKRSLLVLSLAKFNTEVTDCFGIVSDNLQNQLCFWMCPGNFHWLNFTYQKSSSGLHYWQHI